MGSLSIWHWLIVLVIILLVFGTKKLRNAGADLGGAVRSFKEGLKEEDKPTQTSDSLSPPKQPEQGGQVVEGEIKEKVHS